MREMSSKQLEILNKDYDGGHFFEALVVTTNTTTGSKDYFANSQRPVVFEGNEYEVLLMNFGGLNISQNMEIPTNQITIMNLRGKVGAYVFKNNVHVQGNDIRLLFLHMDNYGEITLYDEDVLQIQVVKASAGQGVATIFAGLNLRFTDPVPRKTIETEEFPMIRADVIRVG